MAFLKANFAHGTLASTLSAAATQLTMTAGHSLPTASGEFRLVIWDAATYPNPSDDSNVEIVTGSFNAGNVYDILRAEESTSDVEHAAGSKVGLHYTAGVSLDDLANVSNAFKTFFLSDTGSGVGSLNYAYPHETGEAQSTIVTAGLGTGDGQLIQGYITEAGEPGTTTIHNGVFPVHIHAKKGASNQKTTQLYAILSSVDADGTTNKTTIVTSDISDVLTDTEAVRQLHMAFMENVEVASTARLILDVYANVGSGAVDSVVTLYMEGTEDSYWSTAVDSGIWQTHGDVLDDLNTLGAAASDGQFIVATGAGAFAYESGSDARDSLSLGTGDSPTFAAASLGTGELTVGSINRASGTILVKIGGTATLSIAPGVVNVGTVTLQKMQLGGIDFVSRNVANGALSFSSNASNIDFNPASGVTFFNQIGQFGLEGVTRGELRILAGAAGNTPATLVVMSPNTTNWWIFVEDDGTLKIHNALPTQNSDGSVVGAQT